MPRRTHLPGKAHKNYVELLQPATSCWSQLPLLGLPRKMKAFLAGASHSWRPEQPGARRGLPGAAGLSFRRQRRRIAEELRACFGGGRVARRWTAIAKFDGECANGAQTYAGDGDAALRVVSAQDALGSAASRSDAIDAASFWMPLRVPSRPRASMAALRACAASIFDTAS